MQRIKKAIIPIAGLGTRFLPLSKVLPKEFWPLVDKPIIQYIVEEARNSGIEEIIFVNRPNKKIVMDYFRKYLGKMPELEGILKARKKNNLLEELKNLEKISNEISFTEVQQKKPLGDGHAILTAKEYVKQEPCGVLFGDDIVASKTPCLAQLIKVFRKYRKPVVALYKLPKERLPFYGIVKVKKISERLYEIQGIKEKPSIKESPSNLAIVGKYVLTPEIFNYLQRSEANEAKEIILADALRKSIEEGNKVYGYKFEGKWLECGNKLAYLKSSMYLTLNHPEFGPKLKKFLKNIND